MIRLLLPLQYMLASLELLNQVVVLPATQFSSAVGERKPLPSQWVHKLGTSLSVRSLVLITLTVHYATSYVAKVWFY